MSVFWLSSMSLNGSLPNILTPSGIIFASKRADCINPSTVRLSTLLPLLCMLIQVFLLAAVDNATQEDPSLPLAQLKTDRRVMSFSRDRLF